MTTCRAKHDKKYIKYVYIYIYDKAIDNKSLREKKQRNFKGWPFIYYLRVSRDLQRLSLCAHDLKLQITFCYDKFRLLLLCLVRAEGLIVV